MKSLFYGSQFFGTMIWLLASQLYSADEAAFFEAKVRPIFVKHCLDCHSGDDVMQGGLALDTKMGMLAGGDSGPAIVIGNADQSRLIQAVRGHDPSLTMPPLDSGDQLTDQEIASLVAWVNSGAYDPRTSKSTAVRPSWEEAYSERSRWWSLQPVVAPAIPAIADPRWNSVIDRFLFQAMCQHELVPAEPAEAHALVRRATLTLTGLPPTPAESSRFLADWHVDPEQAYRQLVERLLASAQYGERIARHWLDVVRFTETHGNEWNYDFPYAWRYRDYVIRAFNEDIPFNQFAREHIAGDLIPPRIFQNCNESAIGTAFYRFGEVNHDSCVQFSVIGYDIVDNQLDTLTKAFQATTVACARCHDHKLDAVSTDDYHALLGVLRSSRSVQRTLDTADVNKQSASTLRQLKRELRAELSQLWLSNAKAIDSAQLDAALVRLPQVATDLSHPLHRWTQMIQFPESEFSQRWQALNLELQALSNQRKSDNRQQFELLADLRQGVPCGWVMDGLGLRDHNDTPAVDFSVSHSGETIVDAILPRGLYTFRLSKKLNGALRSTYLPRKHAKISFEVQGGRFSLARLVFNNCQLNYNHQHSIHHDDWGWITIDFPSGTEGLQPYLELLTYWDNPKFPDPLGTLGKDTENQREPYAFHAADPHTWWGIRRIVTHDVAQTPQDELTHLWRLTELAPPQSRAELAAQYAMSAAQVVQRFADDQATDDDVCWLDALLRSGLLVNAASQTSELQSIVARYRQCENELKLPTVMPGMADEGPGFDQPLLARGDHLKPSEPIRRGYVSVLTPLDRRDRSPFGRRELAELMTAAENPLIARVYVNRVWQWIFGRGLVATPDDFGHLGEQPTHPELLDRLAFDFVHQGWSTKQLIREMMMSQAFRSASRPTASASTLDPDNRWLSHFSARRVEAEVIRDSLLAVSGRLDCQIGGPSVHPYRQQADTEKRLYVGPLDGDGRRSIYQKFQLMEAPHFLRSFNLPGGKVTQGRRDDTNVPAQSLAMLNDPFVVAMADAWSQRLIEDGANCIEDRIDAMFCQAVGHLPTSEQRTRFATAVERLGENHPDNAVSILKRHAVWKDAAHLLFNMAEFRFVL